MKDKRKNQPLKLTQDNAIDMTDFTFLTSSRGWLDAPLPCCPIFPLLVQSIYSFYSQDKLVEHKSWKVCLTWQGKLTTVSLNIVHPKLAESWFDRKWKTRLFMINSSHLITSINNKLYNSNKGWYTRKQGHPVFVTLTINRANLSVQKVQIFSLKLLKIAT